MRLCYKQMLNKIYHKKKNTQQKKSNKNLKCTKSLLKIKKTVHEKNMVHDLKTLAQPLWTISLSNLTLAHPL